jgi:hypothetical protein
LHRSRGKGGAFLDKGRNSIYDKQAAFRKESASMDRPDGRRMYEGAEYREKQDLFVEEIW